MPPPPLLSRSDDIKRYKAPNRNPGIYKLGMKINPTPRIGSSKMYANTTADTAPEAPRLL